MKTPLTILALFVVAVLQPGLLEAQQVEPEPAAPAEGEIPLTREALQEIALEEFQTAFDEERAKLERQRALAMAEIASKAPDAAVAPPTPNSASTTRDLLSLLVGALDLGKLSAGDGKDLVLALNPEFFDLGGGQGSGKVTFREPEIFEPLALKLPEDTRESRKLALLDGLNEFNDTEVVVTWSWEGSRFGRDPRDYRALTQSLADALAPSEDESAMMSLLSKVEEIESEVVVRLAAQEAGRAAIENLAAVQRRYEETGFFKLGDLIANQPQLYVDATGRFRDPLVGRDEYGVEAAWEVGFGNVNGLLRDCAPNEEPSREARLKSVAKDVNCYKQFLADHAEDWSKRFVIKLEYSKTDAYHHDLPDDDVSLDLDSAHTFRITGGFGFDLAPLHETGNSPPRLDFEAKYESVSDDDVRNDDRLSAALTYTQKMSESSSASLSVVYASDPKYLGEVEEEISAHVGLKIKVDSKQAKQGS